MKLTRYHTNEFNTVQGSDHMGLAFKFSDLPIHSLFVLSLPQLTNICFRCKNSKIKPTILNTTSRLILSQICEQNVSGIWSNCSVCYIKLIFAQKWCHSFSAGIALTNSTLTVNLLMKCKCRYSNNENNEKIKHTNGFPPVSCYLCPPTKEMVDLLLICIVHVKSPLLK